MDFKFHVLENITNNFSDANKISSDGFGDVYKGVYNGEEIAVKKLHMLPGFDDKSFENEIYNLRTVRHPNVILLIGFCYESFRKFVEHNGRTILAEQVERLICYEYLQGGSLENYIGDDLCDLDWPTCYQIIKGTCEGLNYLHNGCGSPILHLDLKPSYILLDSNMTAKISGFDLSRTCSTPFKTDVVVGTSGYMPPEYMESGRISIKNDIYSLGVIIIEMMAGRRGMKRCREMAPKRFINLVSKTWEKKLQETLEYSSYIIAISQVKKFVEIALSCLDVDPHKRPSIMVVLNELEGRKISQSSAEDEHEHVNGLEDLVHDASADPIDLPLAVLRDITLNFADERNIGQGGFGTVYKGVLQTGSVVAIKRLFNSQTIEAKPFYDEATFMMDVKHPNIVRFLGYCADTEHEFIKMEVSGDLQIPIYAEKRERLLCFEYMSNGGLDKHLTDELRGLEWHTRYQIIKGICKGLQYLHKNSIAHMDLKPANILLDDDMVPKIADFGGCRNLDGVSRYVTQRILASIGYCAPEYFCGGEVSLDADIFCLGAIIRDIVTGRKEDIDRKNVLRRWRYRWNKSGKYPPLGYEQISKCIGIARRCLVTNPKLRPYISEIVTQNGLEKTNNHITSADESTVGQISPNPWELLEIDPLELNFPFKPNSRIQSSVELNNEKDDYIAFDIQKPRNTLTYVVNPNKGIIPPHSRSTVTVTFQASERAPGAMLCKDNFIMRCAIVGGHGLTAANINEDVFDTKLGKVVDEVMLTVAFTNE